jgi:hypothetical protein
VLDVLFSGLKTSHVRLDVLGSLGLIKKDLQNFSAVFFSNFWYETLGPDQDSIERLDSDPDSIERPDPQFTV